MAELGTHTLQAVSHRLGLLSSLICASCLTCHWGLLLHAQVALWSWCDSQMTIRHYSRSVPDQVICGSPTLPQPTSFWPQALVAYWDADCNLAFTPSRSCTQQQ